MTSAERQRRFLDRIRGTGTAQPHPSELEAENAKLKKLLAEAMLDNVVLKDIAAKKW